MTLRLRCGCDEILEVDAAGGEVRCTRCGRVHGVLASDARAAAPESRYPCERCGVEFPFVAMIKHQGRRLCRGCFGAGRVRIGGPLWRRVGVGLVLLGAGAGIGGFAAFRLGQEAGQAPSPLATPAAMGAATPAPSPPPDPKPTAATAPGPAAPATTTGAASAPRESATRPLPPHIPPDRTSLLVATDAGRAALRVGRDWIPAGVDTLGVDKVHCVFVDRDGRIWLGGDGAVVRHAAGEALGYGADSGVPAAPIARVFQDGAGRIWLGSWGKGIAYLALDRWCRMTTAEGLCHDETNDFALAWHDYLWVGTDGGVSVLRDLEFLGGAAVQQLATLNVKSATHDPGGRVYLGCTTGLLVIDPDMTFKWLTPQQGLPQRTPQALLLDSRGRLWAGTWGGGVGRIDTGTLAAVETDTELRIGNVGGLCEDGARRIWAASLDTGLWCHDAGAWTRTDTPAGFESLRVVAALPDALAQRLATGHARVAAAPASAIATAPVAAVTTGQALRVRNDWSGRILVTIGGATPFALVPGQEQVLELPDAWYETRLACDDGAYVATTQPVFAGGLWRIQADLAGADLPRIAVEAQAAAGDEAAGASQLAQLVVNESGREASLRTGDSGTFHCLAAADALELVLPDRNVVAVLSAQDQRAEYHVVRPRTGSVWAIRAAAAGRLALVAREPAAADVLPSAADPLLRPEAAEAARARLAAWLDAAPAGRLRAFTSEQRVTAAVLTPDGALLAATGDEICAWDMVTGDVRWRQPGHGAASIAIAPTGWIWAVDRRGQRFSRRDPRTGREVGGVYQRRVSAETVAIARECRRSILATDAGALLICDLETGTLDGRLASTPAGAVRCAAVDPAGQVAAEGCADGSIRTFDLAAGTLRSTRPGHEGWVNAIAFAPDGQRALSGDGHFQSGGIQSLGPSSAGPHVGGTVRLWAPGELGSGIELGRHGRPVARVAFSDDGRSALSAGYDGRAIVWDVAERKAKATLDPADGPIFDAGFGPDGRLAFTVSTTGVVLWRIGKD